MYAGLKFVSVFSPEEGLACLKALLSLPTTANKRYYFSMQVFILYHHSSNNAAVIAIVTYPIKQLTCVLE